MYKFWRAKPIVEAKAAIVPIMLKFSSDIVAIAKLNGRLILNKLRKIPIPIMIGITERYIFKGCLSFQMILPRSKTKIGIEALIVCANETGTFEIEKWEAAREKNFPNDKGRIVHFSV